MFFRAINIHLKCTVKKDSTEWQRTMARVPVLVMKKDSLFFKEDVLTLLSLFWVLNSVFPTNTNLGTNAGNAGEATRPWVQCGDDVTGTDNSFFGRNSAVVLTSGNYIHFLARMPGMVRSGF